jgi:hypothetical protein
MSINWLQASIGIICAISCLQEIAVASDLSSTQNKPSITSKDIRNALSEFSTCLTANAKDVEEKSERALICGATIVMVNLQIAEINFCIKQPQNSILHGHGVSPTHERAYYYLEIECPQRTIGVTITGTDNKLKIESIGEVVP